MTPGPGRYMDEGLEARLRTSSVPRRALFLDRDGVVNVDHGYVHTPGGTDWVPGIFELCRAAAQRGYLLVVVTNQAGIARQLYTEQQFLDYTCWMHGQFADRGVPLAATYYCPHHPTEGHVGARVRCTCRKPGPGMIVTALAELGIDPATSVMVGDKPSDVAAGEAARLGSALLFDPEEVCVPHGGPMTAIRTLDEAARYLETAGGTAGAMNV